MCVYVGVGGVCYREQSRKADPSFSAPIASIVSRLLPFSMYSAYIDMLSVYKQ